MESSIVQMFDKCAHSRLEWCCCIVHLLLKVGQSKLHQLHVKIENVCTSKGGFHILSRQDKMCNVDKLI